MFRVDQKGFAMPAAIGALVIVGVLVTSGFYLAQQELRIGVASEFAGYAVNLAQEGANDVMLNETSAVSGLAIWGDSTFMGTETEGNWSVTVLKLSSRLYFLDATGTVTKGGELWGGATRRIGVTARLTSASMDPPAALTTQGNLRVGGSAMINGNDSIPSEWGASLCDTTALMDKPGIMIDDSTNIRTLGRRYAIEGSPPYDQDTTISAATLLDFGDFNWDDLVALAEVNIAAAATLTRVEPDSLLMADGSYECATTSSDVWGDPLDPWAVCGGYFPIIYGAGDLTINGDYGQGILLVEGDLRVQGGFAFYGPVYVRGELVTAGTGGHFTGGVVAANVNLDTSDVLGNALVSYSSCAIERAVLGNSSLTKLRPIAMRSWVDLSNVVN